MNSTKPSHTSRSDTIQWLGLTLKPWPMRYLLVNLFVVAALFATAHVLPTGTMKYADLVGGALGGVTLSYLSYSGNSFVASPLRARLALVAVVVGVTLIASVVAQLMVGGVVV